MMMAISSRVRTWLATAASSFVAQAKQSRASVMLALMCCVPTGCAGGLFVTRVQHSATPPSNVAIYFRVSDFQGTPVGGLSAEQFNIYEDEGLVSVYESKQTILNPEVAAAHLTLLLVDMSGSVSQSDDATEVMEAASVFASKLGPNNKVAIYAFDGAEDIHRISKFTSSSGNAQARVASLGRFKSKDSSTNLNGAVVKALAVLDEALDDAKNPLRFGTLVVFSDGTDRASRVTRDDMLKAVGDSPYEIFAIGLGGEIRPSELEAIGRSGTSMAYDRSAIVQAFENVAERIENITKSYYLLSYCSPARARAHTLRIEAVQELDSGKLRKGSLTTRFEADGFDTGCDPTRPPKFDITKGEAQIAPESRKSRR